LKYNHLGRSGLVVSQLCLGTMNFGGQASEQDAHQIMDRALELGINFFDTANAHGRSIKFGFTEEIIGRWFARGDGRREKVVLATKLYASSSEWPNDGRLSARNIRQACEASLSRLQTDHLDLYQMHHIDRETPFEEIWEAYEVLRQQGKVIYAGSSNFAGWHIAKAQEQARQRHFQGLISEQSLYNLLTRDVELEVLPACRDYGLGMIPWSPLGSGILGGALQKQRQGRRSDKHVQDQIEKLRPQLKAYEAFCRKRGEHPALVALGWLLHQEGVAAPIIGPRTLEQLESANGATQIKLNKRDLEELDQIFPGPGAPAPEAYAW
jgi:aryl-alcohol dehydrogenase-like predicted oxidoreductase